MLTFFRESFRTIHINFIVVLTFITYLDAGIVQADHFVLGTKKIYLFGDNHDAGDVAANEQQTKDFIQALLETVPLRKEQLRFLWEKPADSVREDEKDPNILVNIDFELANHPHVGITIEDTDIRKTGNSCNEILGDDVPVDWRKYPGTHDYKDEPALAKLTFRHMIESYEKNRDLLRALRKEHSDGIEWQKCDDELEYSEVGFDVFKGLLERSSISLDTNLCEFRIRSFRDRSDLPSQLHRNSFSMLGHLYNAYLCYLINTSLENEIGIIAGGGHIDPVVTMLKQQGATLKVHFNTDPHSKKLHFDTDPNEGIDNRSIRLLSKSELLTILQGHSLSFTMRTMLFSMIRQVILYMMLGAIYFGEGMNRIMPKSSSPTIS